MHCTSNYAFSEKLKFIFFKIDKTTSKNLNEEEHRQSGNKEFEVFERVIPVLL